MASLSSLLQPPSLLRSSPSSSSSSSSSSSAFMCSLPRKIETATRAPLHASSKRHRHGLCLKDGNVGKQRGVVSRSTVDEVYLVDPPPVNEATAALKLKLLSIVSGLNRGLAASVDDLQKADAAAKELEDVGGLVDLSTDIDKLQGRWKLIYSSAFSSRTLGGSRPGPPTGRLLPITLGQVFQRIDIFSKDFDNIVELELGAPWPIPPVEVTATLAHKFELIGSAKIRIIFEKTTVKTKGTLSQLPRLEVPRIPDALRPPSNTGSGEFEVTYLDSNTRITRGDRDELRVFVLA